MRKKTLYSICFFLATALIIVLQSVASAQGINLPFIGLVSPSVAAFLLVPILIVPLALINKRILAWRKAQGRDIEAEEKHEFGEADIISLRPRQPHEHSSTYRRWDNE
jgi:hypothetical protein